MPELSPMPLRTEKNKKINQENKMDARNEADLSVNEFLFNEISSVNNGQAGLQHKWLCFSCKFHCIG